MTRSLLFFVFFMMATHSSVYADVPVERLDQSWMVFNDSYKTYVPYIPSEESPKVLYYSLKPSKYQRDTLQFMSDKGLCIYFDYRLIYQNNEKGARLIKIPIHKLSSLGNADSVLLAFYRQEGINVSRLKAVIVTQGHLLKAKSGDVGIVTSNILPRSTNNWPRTLLYTVLSVILLLVVGKVIFPEGVSFWRLLGSMNAGAGGPLNGLLWVKIFINSLCISTFTYFLLTSVWVSESPLLTEFAFTKNSVSYGSILFWTLMMHLLKFGFNYVCANFSNMAHLLQAQNFMFVNLFYVLNLVLLPLLIFCNVSAVLSEWVVQNSTQVIGLYFTIPVVVLIINIIKLSGLRNVYLFSYICTAEILPLILALKFLA